MKAAAYIYPGTVTCGACGHALVFEPLSRIPGSSAVGSCRNFSCAKYDEEVRIRPMPFGAMADKVTG